MTEFPLQQAAPYGVRKDGQPKRRPGRPPGTKNRPKPASAASVGVPNASVYRQIIVADEEPSDVRDEPITDDELEADRSWMDPDPSDRERVGKLPEDVARPVRVTAAVKKDIKGKLAFLLSWPAAVWEVRDEYCGGVFREQIPEISDATVDLIVDSPELVKWFTSGGDFMKWLQLASVLQPVGVAMWRHHISHSIGHDDDERPAVPFDPQLYPAQPVGSHFQAAG